MRQRSMHRFAALITLLALLLTLAACGKTAPPEIVDQTAPEMSTPTEEQQREPVPIRELTCLADAAPVTLAAPGGEGRALVCCADYRTGGGQLTFELVDLRNDRVLASLDMEGDYWFPLGCRNNGELLIANSERGILLRCDETLSTLETLPFPGQQAVFSRDEDCVYTYTPLCLTRLELSGETRELLRFHNGAVIEDVDPDAHLILASGMAANEQADALYGVYEFDGKLIWTQETTAMTIGFTGECC